MDSIYCEDEILKPTNTSTIRSSFCNGIIRKPTDCQNVSFALQSQSSDDMSVSSNLLDKEMICKKTKDSGLIINRSNVNVLQKGAHYQENIKYSGITKKRTKIYLYVSIVIGITISIGLNVALIFYFTQK